MPETAELSGNISVHFSQCLTCLKIMPGIFSGPAEDKAVRDLLFITACVVLEHMLTTEREPVCILASRSCDTGNNRTRLHCVISLKKGNTFFFFFSFLCCLNVCVGALRSYAHCSQYSQKNNINGADWEPFQGRD